MDELCPEGSQTVSLSEEVEAKLIYETLGSAIVERTLAATKTMGIGKWKQCGPGYRLDDLGNKVRHYVNTGIPVTFEFTEYPDGRIEKTRERSTFIWEDGFAPFDEWLHSGIITADWMDGIFFKTTRPEDFRFGYVDETRHSPWDTNLSRRRSRVHFQPLSFRPDYDKQKPHMRLSSYDYPLEIDAALENVGSNLDLSDMGDNYYSVAGDYGMVRTKLLALGFKEHKLWTKPLHHKLG